MLEKGKYYIVDLGYKFKNSLVLAEYGDEVRIDDNILIGYSVKPINVIKDKCGWAKDSIGYNICVDIEQIKEVK